jgi:hypothetical protein
VPTAGLCFGGGLATKRSSRSVRVQYYRIIVSSKRDPLVRLDVDALHRKIEGLPFDEAAPDSRYYRSADSDLYMAWSELVNGKLRMTVGKELVDASPAYEKEGDFQFATLDDKSRWIAPSYCVFFPDKNVAGIIFSQEGPRVASILQYFTHGVVTRE